MIDARVLADSINTNGERLTTLEVTMPRYVLAEFNTHRALSRNSASMRAIPVQKILDRVRDHPYVPGRFSLNAKGMSAKEYIDQLHPDYDKTVQWWLNARDDALNNAEMGLAMGLHKQVVNRMLEPWLYQTVIVSATDWKNFFDLRLALDEDGNPLADDAIYQPAKRMKEMILLSTPRKLSWNDWHLPLTGFPDEDLSLEDLKKVSVARCARVSYLTHHGLRNTQADIDLFDRLLGNGHLSPFEHVASPAVGRHANFNGWKQLRHYLDR